MKNSSSAARLCRSVFAIGATALTALSFLAPAASAQDQWRKDLDRAKLADEESTDLRSALDLLDAYQFRRSFGGADLFRNPFLYHGSPARAGAAGAPAASALSVGSAPSVSFAPGDYAADISTDDTVNGRLFGNTAGGAVPANWVPLGTKLWFVADTAKNGVNTAPNIASILDGDDFLVYELFTPGDVFLPPDPFGSFAFTSFTPDILATYSNAYIHMFLWNTSSASETTGDKFGTALVATGTGTGIGGGWSPTVGNASWDIASNTFWDTFTVTGVAPPPVAVGYQWTNELSGAGAGNWSTAISWEASTLPVSDSNAIVRISNFNPTDAYPGGPAAGNTALLTTNDLGEFRLHQLNLSNSAVAGLTVASSVGSSINFMQLNGTNPSLNVAGASNITLSSPLGLTSDLNINGEATPTNRNVTISGRITNLAGANHDLIFTSAGLNSGISNIFIINNPANELNGSVIINSGRVQVSGTNSGDPTIVRGFGAVTDIQMNGGRLDLIADNASDRGVTRFGATPYNITVNSNSTILVGRTGVSARSNIAHYVESISIQGGSTPVNLALSWDGAARNPYNAMNNLTFNNSALNNRISGNGHMMMMTNFSGVLPTITIAGSGAITNDRTVVVNDNLTINGSGTGTYVQLGAFRTTLVSNYNSVGYAPGSAADLGPRDVTFSAGNGTVILAGANTNAFRGRFILDSGVVQLNGTAALPFSTLQQAIQPDVLILDGGTLRAGAATTIPLVQGITVNSASTIDTVAAGTVLQLGSKIIGAGALTFNGPGVLQFNSLTNLQYTNRPNTWTGGLVQNGGVVRLNTGPNDGGMTQGENWTINGGKISAAAAARTTTNAFIVNGNFQVGEGTTVGDLAANASTLTFAGTMDIGSTTRQIRNNITNRNNAFVINAPISGTGGLEFIGGGGTRLSGANTFTGDVTLNEGVLRAGTSDTATTGAFGKGTLIINSNNVRVAAQGGARTISNSVSVLANFMIGETPLANDGINIYNGGAPEGTNALTMNGAMNLNAGTRTITVGDRPNKPVHQIGGVISNGDLVVDGDGVLRLNSSANTFSSLTLGGTATVIAGNNSSATGGPLGVTGGTITMGNGTTLAATGAATRTVTNNLVINGNVTFGQNNTVIVAPAAVGSFPGTNNLAIQGTTDLGGAGRNITVATTTASVAGQVVAALNGEVSNDGGGGITKLGGGILALGASNSFTGDINLNEGTIRVNNNNALGSADDAGTLNWAAGTTLSAVATAGGTRTITNVIVLAGTSRTIGEASGGTAAINLTSDINLNAVNQTFIVNSPGASNAILSGVLSSAGTITKQGTGSLLLTGANTYGGGSAAVTILAGAVGMNSDASLGLAPGAFTADNIVIDGGILRITNSANSAAITLNQNRGIQLGSAVNNGNGTIDIQGSRTLTNYASVISSFGAGNALVKTGDGTLRQEVVNTYTGGTIVNQGTLLLAGTNLLTGAPVGDGALGAAGTSIRLNNATLQQVAIEGAAGGFEIDSARSLLAGASGNTNFALLNNVQYYGVVADGGTGNGIRITGGTVRLGSANTFTGQTRIELGTLQVAGDGAFGAGSGPANIVFTNGTLQATNSFELSAARGIQLGTGANHQNVQANFNIDAGVQMIYNGNIVISTGITNEGGAVGSLIKSGAGELILGGTAHTYTNLTRVNAGTLTIGAENNIGGNADLLVNLNNGALRVTNSLTLTSTRGIAIGTNNNNGGTLDITTGNTVTYNGVISNGWNFAGTTHNALTKVGQGTLVLGGANTFDGVLTIQDGTVQQTVSSSLFNGGNITNVNVQRGVYELDPGVTQTIRTTELGRLGSASIVMGAGSALALTGTGTDTVLYRGDLDNTDIFGASITGGSLVFGQNSEIDVRDNTAATDDLTIDSRIVGTDGINTGLRVLTKQGGGTLTLQNIASDNSFSNMVVTGGILRWGADEQIVDARSLTVNGATNELSGFTETIGALAVGGAAGNSLIDLGTGTLNVNGNVSYSAAGSPGTATIQNGSYNLGSATRTFNIANSATDSIDMLISAVVSGTGGLTKTNLGTLELSPTGPNTFSGAVIVQTGVNVEANGTDNVLRVGAGGLAANSALTVRDGGTLLLVGTGNRVNDLAPVTLGRTGSTATIDARLDTGGNSEAFGVLTLSANSVIDFGAGASILSFAGDGAWAAGATLSIWNWSGVTAGGGTDQLIFGVADTGLSATQLGQISFYSDSGSSFLGLGVYAGLGNGEVVPVPEPATWISLGAIASLLGWRERRRLTQLVKRNRR